MPGYTDHLWSLKTEELGICLQTGESGDTRTNLKILKKPRRGAGDLVTAITQNRAPDAYKRPPHSQHPLILFPKRR